MIALPRKRPVPALPASGSTFLMVGDSIMDPYLTGPWPGGQSADTVAAAFGWTRVGKGTGAIVTAPGTGYTAAWSFTTSGGGGSVQATGTTIVYNGGVVGVTWTTHGTGFTSSPTVPNGGGGTGATFAPPISGGAVRDGVVLNSNSIDATRAAMGGTTLQSGGMWGGDLQSNLAARCTAYNAHAVAIFLGTNDYYQHDAAGAGGSGLTVAKFKTALAAAVTGIKATANIRLIMLYGLHNIQVNPGGGAFAIAGYADRNDLIRHFNQVIMEVASDSGAVYVPLISMPAALLVGDGVHPTQGPGHDWITGRVYDALTGHS